MNTIKGMIEDLRRDETHIGGCTTKGELIIALESLERNDKYSKEIDHLHKYIAKLETRIVEQDSVLDELKAEIAEEKEHAYADFERYKVEYLGQDWEDALDSLPQDDFRYGMERCIDIINKYKTESKHSTIEELEKELCEDAISRADILEEIEKLRMSSGVTNQSTWNECVDVILRTVRNRDWFPSAQPTLIKASDIKPDDEWMKENEWDEIYAKDNLPDINVGNIKESEDKA